MPATYALSIEQAHVWRLADPDRRRVQAHVPLPAGVALDAVAGAVERLVEHHEILRTTYVQPAGMRVALQAVHDSLPVPVRSDDAPLDAVLAGEWDAPWNLADDAPLRVVVAGSDLVVTLLALAADPQAAADLAAEVVTLAGGGEPASTEPLQYVDYAQWQHDLHEEPTAEAERAQWAARKPAYAAHLPFERTAGVGPVRPEASPSAPSAPIEVPLTIDMAAASAAGAQYGYDAATFLAACWHACVARLADETEIGIATWCSARDHAELEGSIGAFGRYAPVTIDVDADPTIAEVVDAVGRAHAWSQAHVDQLLPESPDDDADTRIAIAFASVPAGVRGCTDSFAAELRFDPLGASLLCSAAAFAPDDARRIAEQLEALIRGALLAPDTAVSRLPLLDAAARATLLANASEGDTMLSPRTVLDGFEGQAASAPQREAVNDGARSLTYEELDALAAGVGDALREAGVRPGAVVGLCADRSVSMLAALLGIWKAGAAYVPLNFEHPPARLAHQLAETGATVVVTLRALHDHLPHGVRTVDLDEIAPLRSAPTPNVSAATPDALAYVMYTSGSTGLPKGVEVTHANLANYAAAVAARLGLDESTEPLRCATVTAISTDLGNTAIFPALVCGHAVELVAPEVAVDPNRYAAAVAERPVDVLKVTPSHLGALMTAGADRVLPRHTLVLGGEASPWELVAAVRAASACRIVNHYGPTETTVGSCTYAVPDAVPASAPRTLPIGRPLANTRCYVVDRHGEPLPVGVPGELWIGGAGVARGYAAQPDETAARFAADPFAPAPARLYRTGDKARWLPEGDLEFLGRVDDQVKIRGYRIEPREIEQVLQSHPQVRQAAVVAREDVPGDRRLVAYVVADGYPTIDSLRATVSASLPDYMLPSAYLLLGALPLTASGKLDRRALPAPDDSTGELGRPFVAPRSDTEKQLAAFWSEVLHREQVGVEDDFFELGGHSLLAAQVVARVRSAFGVELPLHSLFTAPTIALLAIEVETLTGGELDEAAIDDLLGDLSDLSDDEIERLLREE